VLEDFTIITMIGQIFDALGIGYDLLINSLGCPSCMPAYRENLVGFLTDIKENLCEDCNRRIATNPIRVLDCKNTTCQSLLTTSPKLIDNLCETCQSDFQKLTALLDQAGNSYTIDTHLVRGLDYYNKTAFEFVSNEIGSQSAIAGGGRYDKLVEYLDGKATPAVGFALGIERIMELVQMPEILREGYYLGAMVPEAVDTLLQLANKKRLESKVTVEYNAKGFKSHMKGADRAHARYAVLIGEDELANGTLWIKDLENKEEKSITAEEF
jgi:histidyl-tRNA synthetase